MGRLGSQRSFDALPVVAPPRRLAGIPGRSRCCAVVPWSAVSTAHHTDDIGLGGCAEGTSYPMYVSLQRKSIAQSWNMPASPLRMTRRQGPQPSAIRMEVHHQAGEGRISGISRNVKVWDQADKAISTAPARSCRTPPRFLDCRPNMAGGRRPIVVTPLPVTTLSHVQFVRCELQGTNLHGGAVLAKLPPLYLPSGAAARPVREPAIRFDRSKP